MTGTFLAALFHCQSISPWAPEAGEVGSIAGASRRPIFHPHRRAQPGAIPRAHACRRDQRKSRTSRQRCVDSDHTLRAVKKRGWPLWTLFKPFRHHSEFWCDLKVSFHPGSVEYSVAKLTKSNAYIRTKEQRKDAIARSVISSSACEGVTVQRTDLPLNGRRSQQPSPPTPPKG